MSPIPKVIDQLFMALAGRYLRKWTSLFPTAAAADVSKAQWATDLAGVAEEDIGLALLECRRLYNDWPPTSPEFREVCDAIARRRELRQKEVSDRKALEHLRSRVTAPGDARAHLQHIRQILSGTRKAP